MENKEYICLFMGAPDCPKCATCKHFPGNIPADGVSREELEFTNLEALRVSLFSDCRKYEPLEKKGKTIGKGKD